MAYIVTLENIINGCTEELEELEREIAYLKLRRDVRDSMYEAETDVCKQISLLLQICNMDTEISEKRDAALELKYRISKMKMELEMERRE